MQYRVLLIILSASFLLSACSVTDMQSAIGEINGTLSGLNASLGASGSTNTTQNTVGASATSLTQIKLMGALSRTISTDGSVPEWPKIAITELRIPEDQIKNPRMILKRTDCVQFDAVLWHDPKNKEAFNNVSLCAPELPKQSNGFVTTWQVFSISGKTTGQVRGDGPVPPLYKLPSEGFLYKWVPLTGIYFIGSMLTMMGYDPQFTADDRRFWIKQVKTF